MDKANEATAVAPADSASHAGSFTVPSDVERVAETEQPFPETNQDVNPKREVGGRNWTLVIAVTLLLLVLGLWVGRYMIL